MTSWFDKQYDRLESSWDRSTARKRRWMYVGGYTFLFLVAFLLAFSPYIVEGKTLIWELDGRLQHYPVMVYIGRYIRRVLLNLVHGDFSLPLVDLGINMGGDVLSTLNGNIDSDPLYLLAALVPTAYSEYFYCFLSIFRLWLAGLSFSYLCFYHKKKLTHTLVGSFIYSFSAFACISAARHVYFVNPMIQLPLLLVGMDKVLKKESPWVFIISVFYAAICDGYYFLYQLTLMILIYALVRFFDLYKTHRTKQFVLAVVRGATGYALGVGLSAVIFLPSVINFLHAARSSFSSGFVPTHFTWAYLRAKFLRLILPSSSVAWAHLGLAAIVYFALSLIICTRGRRTLKVLLCIGIFFWLHSVGGYIFHGFQYSINRWIYGLDLLLAYTTVDMLPELTSDSKKQRCVCTVATIIYMAIALSTQKARQYEYVLVALVFLGLTLWILAFQFNENKEKRTKYCSVFLVILVVVNVGVNGIYRTAPDQGNYVSEFSPLGEEVDSLTQSAELAIQPLVRDNPEGRVDGSEFSAKLVSEWFVPKMVFYDALLSSDVFNFWDSVEIRRASSSLIYSSTQQCTVINTLLSEKYQIEPEDSNVYIPYGYKFISDADGGRKVYENEYALPWGYTYDSAISYEEMDRLNGLQKQEAMLQTVALDNAPQKSSASLAFDEQSIPYDAVFEKCKYEDGILTAKKGDAIIHLSFSVPAETECYLRLSGLAINSSNVDHFNISVNCGNVVRKSAVRSKLNHYYYDQTDYLFNLGYSKAERTELTITFPAKGTFQLNDIELYALPMDNYPARVEALRAEPLENIQWGTNSLTGTVDLSKDKILCVSVPYSKGWSATVDGEEAEILRGNYMFMCLPLTAGHHDIEFHYCSPGLKLGAVITVCSAGVVIWMLVRDKKRRKEVGKGEI